MNVHTAPPVYASLEDAASVPNPEPLLAALALMLLRSMTVVALPATSVTAPAPGSPFTDTIAVVTGPITRRSLATPALV